MGDYILGLDLGSASIGWAVVDVVTGHLLAAKPDRDGTPGPPGCGVRIFPESVDRKKNVPYTAQRRTAHGMRRQIRRRVHRKRRLLAKLIAAGLWPADLLAQAQLLDQRGRPTVYELRRRALDEPISAFEFGRILRHLCQRRGFKSNRKTARTSDDGKLYRATAQLQNDMDEATPPSRTLGEHLCRIGAGELPLPQKGVLGTDDAHRIRGRYTLRKMFEAEFEKLWTEQEQYIAELRVHGLRDAIHEIIFYQRPLRSARHLIGRCECIPRLRRCSKADWHAQQFRVLKEVNNLEIHNSDGSVQHLRPCQRKLLVDTLSLKEKMTFNDVRELLGLIETQLFNLEEGPREKRKPKAGKTADASGRSSARKTIKGNTVEAALVEVFGKRWGAFDGSRQAAIRQAVTDTEDPDALIRLAKGWGCSESDARLLADLPLPDGYMAYSLEAIKNLNRELERGISLEQGLREYEAKDRCGYNRFTDKPALDLLPPPENPDRKPLVANPIVRQALYEVRRVVNAIIREYGKPQRIVVEMVREMKGSLRKRAEMVEAQNENRDDRERVRKRIVKDFQIPKPGGADILAYRLWEQQGKVSPYSGRCISQEQLASFMKGEGGLQIDHILPYSRTLDDSQSNKCICFDSENSTANKGDQTPCEWLGEKTDNYRAMLQRVARMKEHGMAWGKRRKFSQKDVRVDDFVERQLNDTAYIAREVRKYLQCLYPGDRTTRDQAVICTRGQVTHDLRWHWGLNGVLSPDASPEKNRLDHRHHAVDAIVVALTNSKRLHALSQTDRALGSRRKILDLPWKGFVAEMETAVKQINVSHRVCARVRGGLHDDNPFHGTRQKGVFAIRKPLKDLTWKEVDKIRDERVKELVKQRLAQYHRADPGSTEGEEADVAGSGKKTPAEAWKEPIYVTRRGSTDDVKHAVVKSVRVWRKDETIRPIRENTPHQAYVRPGNNHHFVLFKKIVPGPDEPGLHPVDAIAVSLLEAAQRLRNVPVRPVIWHECVGQPAQRPHPEAEFWMSLSPGEMVLLDPADRTTLYRFETAPGTSRQLVLRKHFAAAVGNNGKKAPRPWTLPSGTRKVVVDPLGRIRWAGD